MNDHEARPDTGEGPASRAAARRDDARERGEEGTRLAEEGRAARTRAEAMSAGDFSAVAGVPAAASAAIPAGVCARCGAPVEEGRTQCPTCARTAWELAQVAWDEASLARREAMINLGAAEDRW